MTDLPLCYRCEHRALYHETGEQPRMECGRPSAVWGCYMYQPVRPLAVLPNKGERRPIGGEWMIAGRMHAERTAASELISERQGKATVFYLRPINT